MKSLNMSLLPVLLALSFAASALADVTPLTANILACYSTKGKATDFDRSKAIIFRAGGDFVTNGSISDFISGKVYVMRFDAEGVNRSLSTNRMDFEGTTSLPENSGENWTAPAPAGTVFSARGNLIGVFLYNDGTGALKGKVAYRSPDDQMDLGAFDCTSDLATAINWFHSVADSQV